MQTNVHHLQATYDSASFSRPIATMFHGNPACPACGDGQLQLWVVGMAYDWGGDITGGRYHFDDGEPPQKEPRRRYEATLMVCRDLNTDEPGCGFTLPIINPTEVNVRARAEHVGIGHATREDAPNVD